MLFRSQSQPAGVEADHGGGEEDRGEWGGTGAVRGQSSDPILKISAIDIPLQVNDSRYVIGHNSVG